MHLDPASWRRQAPIRSERLRAAPLVWLPGADWFDMPWTGPTPHLHDDATEFGYLAHGSLELKVCGRTRTLIAGDAILIPPARHHAFRLIGDAVACFFIAVAPDHRERRLRQGGFAPDNYIGEARCANLHAADPLPSDEHIRAERAILDPGTALPQVADPQHERILYVAAGRCHAQIGPWAGELGPDRFLHLPAAAGHLVRNPGPGVLMLLSLSFPAP